MQWIIYFVLRFTAHLLCIFLCIFCPIYDGIYSQTALLLGSFFWVIFKALFWHFACVCHWHLQVVFLGGTGLALPYFGLVLVSPACFAP
jgi:hypothetical protein